MPHQHRHIHFYLRFRGGALPFSYALTEDSFDQLCRDLGEALAFDERPFITFSTVEGRLVHVGKAHIVYYKWHYDVTLEQQHSEHDFILYVDGLPEPFQIKTLDSTVANNIAGSLPNCSRDSTADFIYGDQGTFVFPTRNIILLDSVYDYEDSAKAVDDCSSKSTA